MRDRLLPRIGALALLLLTSPVSAERQTPAADEASEQEASLSETESESYRVRAGDTLSGIAERLGVTLDALLHANPGLHPDRIRQGQRLVLRDGRRKVEHTLVAGETVSALAARYGVRVAELRRWNPELDPDRVRAGQVLLLYTDQPLSRSLSVGSPTQGRLLHPERLPPHAGYVIRERGRAWGTLETVQNIVNAFDAVRKANPRAPRLKVHDLSLRDGGTMTDHHSHQSGRDADIAYYQRDCAGRVCGFRRLGPTELDADQTWTLLKQWLERDAAESIFIDYALQGPLYRAAKADGASASQLRKWFQYPSGPTHPLGIVRHFPKHADHMHVRFMCPESDPECVTFRPLLGTATAAR